jgi:hypothetical protein
MKTLNEKIRADHGTTLIELMIALILTGIVTLAIMKTYATQHESYLVQEDVTYMQQSSRACIDELTRQIRMAGHDLPLGLPALVGANTNPDTITITYHGNECDTYLSSAMPNASAELKLATDVSCFQDDQWVYIYEPDSSIGEWFKISEVQSGSNHIQHRYTPKNFSRAYDADAQVLALNQVKFFIDDTTDPTNPKLMIQIGGDPPQPYAEHMSDLQFQYRLANGSLVDEPLLVTDVREVLISITSQSTLSEAVSGGFVADPEDQDAKKERTYNSSVNLRNLGA